MQTTPAHLLTPAQTPAVQTSLTVLALPSSQALPVSSLQVPSVSAPAAFEQASQVPAEQAWLQQTPSTQKPEAHCEAEVQALPGALSG